VTDVIEERPENVFTLAAFDPQKFDESRMRTTFVAASPTPVSCSEHVSVNVQSVAPVYGPEIWNDPMLNE
jgi:hypothetical protein